MTKKLSELFDLPEIPSTDSAEPAEALETIRENKEIIVTVTPPKYSLLDTKLKPIQYIFFADCCLVEYCVNMNQFLPDNVINEINAMETKGCLIISYINKNTKTSNENILKTKQYIKKIDDQEMKTVADLKIYKDSLKNDQIVNIETNEAIYYFTYKKNRD